MLFIFSVPKCTHHLIAVLAESVQAEGANGSRKAQDLWVDPSGSFGFTFATGWLPIYYSLHYTLQDKIKCLLFTAALQIDHLLSWTDNHAKVTYHDFGVSEIPRVRYQYFVFRIHDAFFYNFDRFRIEKAAKLSLLKIINRGW